MVDVYNILWLIVIACL